MAVKVRFFYVCHICGREVPVTFSEYLVRRLVFIKGYCSSMCEKRGEEG